MNSTRTTFLFVFTFLCVFYIHGTETRMVFHTPAELDGISTESPQFKFLGPHDKANITSRVIHADPPTGCDWSKTKNKGDWEGNIIIVEQIPGQSCSPAVVFKNAQKGGALAIYMILPPGSFRVFAGTRYSETYHGPVYGFEGLISSQKTFDEILKQTSDRNTTVIATVHGDDLIAHSGYGIATSVTCGLFALINIIYGGWKLYDFVHLNSFDTSLPQMCLWLEILGNVLRILLALENDEGYGWGVLEWVSIAFFQQMVLPFCLWPTLMIAFYWDRSLKSFEKSLGKTEWNISSIQRWKIPMIVFSILLLVIQIIKATLVALWYGSELLVLIVLLVAAATFLGCGIFFNVTGFKVLRWARRSKSAQTEKSKALSRMLYLIVANAFFLYWCFVCHIILLFDWRAGWLPLLFGINAVSFIQMTIFQPGSGVDASTSAGTAHSKRTSQKMQTDNTIELSSNDKSSNDDSTQV